MKKRLIVIAALIVAASAAAFIFWKHRFQAAPFPLPTSPVVAYRITGDEVDAKLFRDDPASFHGYVIVQEQRVADPALCRELVDLLNSRSIYGGDGATCFEPGFAFRLGDGDARIDALVCLGCRHVYFYRGGQLEFRDLNSIGIDRFKNLYPRLFPGHVADGGDEDTRQAAEKRKRERDHKFQQLQNPESRP